MTPKAQIQAYLDAQSAHIAATTPKPDTKAGRRKRGPTGPKVALTKGLCDWLPVMPFDYEVKDTEVRSLVIRVRSTGTKVLYVAKKIGGRNARSKVCDHGEVVYKRAGTRKGDTVHSLARALLVEMEAGQTATVKTAQRKAAEAEAVATDTTLIQAATHYIKLKKRAPNTTAAYVRHRDNKLAKHWPDKRIVDVSPDDVIALHTKVAAGTGRGYGPSAANSLVGFIRATWKANKRRLNLGECPCSVFTKAGGGEVSLYNEIPRERFVEPGQFAGWWRAVQGLRGAAYTGDGGLMADYLEFALLTGMRRREITSLSRKRGAANRIDTRNNELVISENKSNHDTPGRKKQDRTLRLPITPAVQAILDRRGGSEPFPIDDPKRAIAWVEKQCGVRASSHDLRRTFLTYCTVVGVPLPIAKSLVNHSRADDVTLRYIQLIGTSQAEYLERVQNHMLGLAGARDNVVQLAEVSSG